MQKRGKKKRLAVKKLAYVTGAFVEKIGPRDIPEWAACRIAETIIRHARLEWIQAKVFFNLSEISIKRGRIGFRLPAPGQYVTQLRQHLALSGLRLRGFKIGKLETELKNASAARNALAHSVYVRDPAGKIRIQLVSGTWDLDRQKYEPVYRAISPETPVLTKSWLNRQRSAVNIALRHAIALQRATNRALRALQDKRRTKPALDRRNRGQSQNRLLNLQRPPEAPLHIVQAYRRSLGH